MEENSPSGQLFKEYIRLSTFYERRDGLSYRSIFFVQAVAKKLAS